MISGVAVGVPEISITGITGMDMEAMVEADIATSLTIPSWIFSDLLSAKTEGPSTD
jgi:hypothetical protein